MKSLKRLIGTAFILLAAILSLNSFTNSANAKEATVFYKDQDETNYESLDVLLFTDGKLIYQVFGEDDYFGSLYKLNIIDEFGQKIGSYSFPDNHIFSTKHITSNPVIDKDGNLLISYLKFDSTIDDSPFYLASISPTGKLNWEFETGFLGPNSPIFGSDGTIYFVTSDRKNMHFGDIGYAYALSDEGEELWKQKIVGEAYSTKPFINEDNNLVFSTRTGGGQSLQYTLSTDGERVDLELTHNETSTFYTNGIKYFIQQYYNWDVVMETLKATDNTNKELWNYDTDNKYVPKIDHVTTDGVVYLTSYDERSYDQFVSSIFNGSFNWMTSGIPLYYNNDIYTLNSLTIGSTAISKLDAKSGKAIDTEVLNFTPSASVVLDKDVILLVVERSIYKVSLDNNKTSGWVKKSGKWMYYDQNGKLKTDWLLDKGEWYYLNSIGVMKTGWYQVNEKWYYSTSSGEMQTGWIKDKNKWYFLSSNGAMASGWIKDKGKWYFLSSNGAMKTNWLQQGGKWYFLNSNGDMQTGWKLVNNKWYYFYSSGQMAANTTVGGYKLDKSGAWVQ